LHFAFFGGAGDPPPTIMGVVGGYLAPLSIGLENLPLQWLNLERIKLYRYRISMYALLPPVRRAPTLEAPAATLPRDLAQAYADKIAELLKTEPDQKRRAELETMRDNLLLSPWKPAQDFWQALQALWLTHMLVLSDENYPGAGVSFGRLDQYLLPYYQRSLAAGMDREFCKEILKCFWLHCNYAYDAMIATGDQGITADYGQLFNLSGIGRDGKDTTNELTWVLLEVIDERNWSRTAKLACWLPPMKRAIPI